MPTDVANVRVPPALRQYTGNIKDITIYLSEMHPKHANIGGVIGEVLLEFPDLIKNVIDENGNLRNFVAIFINDEDIRHLFEDVKSDVITKKTDVPVVAGDFISIAASIAGGVL